MGEQEKDIQGSRARLDDASDPEDNLEYQQAREEIDLAERESSAEENLELVLNAPDSEDQDQDEEENLDHVSDVDADRDADQE